MKNRLISGLTLAAVLVFGTVSIPAVAGEYYRAPVKSHYYYDKHKHKEHHYYNKYGKRHHKYYQRYYKHRAQAYQHRHPYRYRYYYAPRHHHTYSAPRIIFGFGF